jgi:hypothetical protein
MSRYNRKFLGHVLSLTCIGSMAGCSTVAKQAYYTAAGASGKFYEIHVVDPSILGSRKSLRVGDFKNDLGEIPPSAIFNSIASHTRRLLGESALFSGSGDPLEIQGLMIHYTGPSSAKGAVRSKIGRQDCVCRVRLLDGNSGSLIGEAVCWGVTRSAVRRDHDELAEGVAKGIVKWIKRRHPAAVEDSDKEESGD